MTTTVERGPKECEAEERKSAKKVDHARSAEASGRWARACASSGAVAWAALAVLARLGIARIGQIELLFLFAPLVIFPLGMEVGRMVRESSVASRELYRSRLESLSRIAQPFGAAAAVVSFLLPPGRVAGAIALGWMVVCALAAADGARELLSLPWKQRRWGARAAFAMAQVDLAVGGAWLVASRLGMRPMGIQEPIGLLTAVHFHFAGFATATIAAALLRFAERRAADRRLQWVVVSVLVMPYIVAAGFVISPTLKMAAAVIFSLSVAGLAVLLREYAAKIDLTAARVQLQVSSAVIFAGMVLAATYAIADLMKADILPIPQMARTHGLLNAIGFCLPGLLGWLLEFDREPERNNS